MTSLDTQPKPRDGSGIRICQRRGVVYSLKEERMIATVPMLELLTYDDVAKLLRMTGRNVSNLVKAGRLPAVKLGPRSVRFDPADVRRFIEGCKTSECVLN